MNVTLVNASAKLQQDAFLERRLQERHIQERYLAEREKILENKKAPHLTNLNEDT